MKEDPSIECNLIQPITFNICIYIGWMVSHLFLFHVKYVKIRLPIFFKTSGFNTEHQNQKKQ